MKTARYLLIGMSLGMGSLLRAGPPDIPGEVPSRESKHLQKHEKNLERMQATRSVNDEHTRQATEEFRRTTDAFSGLGEQQKRDVEELKSVEGQLVVGRRQKSLARQSYRDAAHQFGQQDPRSAAAKVSWKQRQQEMRPLLESRKTLKQGIHRGGRQLHNHKVVLSVQKRDMKSDAQYRAIDDRAIRKVEKRISDGREAIIQNYRPSGLP